jgi:hypothetical protein
VENCNKIKYIALKWPFSLKIRFLEEIGFLFPKDEMLARRGKLLAIKSNTLL